MLKVYFLLLFPACYLQVSLPDMFLPGLREHKSLDQETQDTQESLIKDSDDDKDVTKLLFSLDELIGEEERNEKSLLNTFPFNSHTSDGNHDHEHGHHSVHHDHGHHEHGHHEAHANHETHSHDATGSRGVSRFPFGQQLNTLNSGLGQSQLETTFPFADRDATFRQENADEEEEADAGLFLNTVATDGINENGRKCIDKVMMLEETVYDEVITCDHSYDKRCHTSYVTNYESQQEEECEENFKKVCMINYEDLAYNSTVEICRTPLVKDCDIPGEEVCQTIYESSCATVQLVHEVEDDVTNCRTEQMKKCKEVTEGYTTREDCDEWPVQRCSIEKKKVKKYTPETKCHKEPKQMCAARGCGFSEGDIECHDKVKTVVVENPVETCEVEPVRTCRHVTKLVPKLVPVQECADVPKEICARSKTNPRKVKKPVIKKWCYVPSKESGLL